WRYLSDGRKARFWSLGICATLIFYAHPAGIYLVIALCTAVFFAFSGSWRNTNRRRQRSTYVAIITALGGIAGGIAYLPVLHQLLHNPWVEGHKITYFQFLRGKLLSCSLQLWCSRYWLIIIVAIGCAYWWRQRRKTTQSFQNLRWIVFAVIIYVVTFLIPFL